MRVAELQSFLGNIAPFAKAAGASEKVAVELDRAVQCLEPFKEKTLAEFNDFLRRADEFDRTGKLVPTTGKSARARTPKAPALTVDEAVRVFNELHERATDPTLSYADIDARLKGLEKLTVPQLKEVAGKLNITMPAKTKKAMLEELARRIKELKGSHERTQFRFGETA
jgi:hypothetical protein